MNARALILLLLAALPAASQVEDGEDTPQPGPRRAREDLWSYSLMASPSGDTTYQTSLTACPLMSSGVSSAAK